jgi:hypothetical protein
MGIGKPHQAQRPDDEHLPNNRMAVNQEGTQTASDGRLYEVKHVHNTALSTSKLVTLRTPCPGSGVFSQRFSSYRAISCYTTFSYAWLALLPSQKANKPQPNAIFYTTFTFVR